MNTQPTSGLRRRGIKGLVGATVFALAATGFIGFLHTSAGRPLLARLGVGCPVKRVTPQQAEALRQQGVAAVRGGTPAPSRPALGMRLDDSTESEVIAWAAQRRLACKAVVLGLHQVQCTNVPALALAATAFDNADTADTAAAVDELTFAFNPAGSLISVEVFRSRLSPAHAADLFSRQTRDLTAALGEAPVQLGQPTSTYLASGPLQTVLATYRFSDYLASVTAMTLPGGVSLRAQYQSATRVQ